MYRHKGLYEENITQTPQTNLYRYKIRLLQKEAGKEGDVDVRVNGEQV